MIWLRQPQLLVFTIHFMDFFCHRTHAIRAQDLSSSKKHPILKSILYLSAVCCSRQSWNNIPGRKYSPQIRSHTHLLAQTLFTSLWQAAGYTEAFIYSTNSTQRNLYSAAVFRKPVNTHFPSQIHPQCIFHSIVFLQHLLWRTGSAPTRQTASGSLGGEWDGETDKWIEGCQGRGDKRQPPVL